MIPLFRKTLLFVFACVLVSCSSENSLEENVVSQYSFQLMGVTQGPIEDLCTRAVGATATYSLLVVDVKDGELQKEISRIQVPIEEALSNVELVLGQGSHTIYFLCAAKPWDNFDQSSLLVSWNKKTSSLGDTWTAKYQVNVTNSDSQSKSIQLSRAVSYLRVTIDDALPTNLATFKQSIVGGSWTYNLANMSGDLPVLIESEISVPSSFLGQAGKNVSIYTFIPAGATSAQSYTLTGKDADGVVIKEHTFSSVPLVLSQYTNYKGVFFDPAPSSYALSLESDWKEPNVILF